MDKLQINIYANDQSEFDALAGPGGCQSETSQIELADSPLEPTPLGS